MNKVWRIRDCKLKKYAKRLGRYSLFAANEFRFNKVIKIMSVFITRVPIRSAALLFRGFCLCREETGNHNYYLYTVGNV